MRKIHSRGFTIVELIAVIAIIGILAALTLIAYRGVKDRALSSAVITDLSAAHKQLTAFESDNYRYPANLTEAVNSAGLKGSPGTIFQYTLTGSTYCLTATKSKKSLYIQSSNTEPQPGVCAGHTP